MEKMREEFQTWFWDYHHKNSSMDYWSIIFAIGCDGKYQGIACEGAWQGWKASRSVMCVELPSYQCDQRYKDGVLDANKVFEALEKAGVSYK